MLHLEDDVTKDYLKGKDVELMLDDRYIEGRKKINEKEKQMYGICLYILRSHK